MEEEEIEYAVIDKRISEGTYTYKLGLFLIDKKKKTIELLGYAYYGDMSFWGEVGEKSLQTAIEELEKKTGVPKEIIEKAEWYETGAFAYESEVERARELFRKYTPVNLDREDIIAWLDP